MTEPISEAELVSLREKAWPEYWRNLCPEFVRVARLPPRCGEDLVSHDPALAHRVIETVTFRAEEFFRYGEKRVRLVLVDP